MQKARFSIFWDLGSPVQIFAKTNGNQKKKRSGCSGSTGRLSTDSWESGSPAERFYQSIFDFGLYFHKFSED